MRAANGKPGKPRKPWKFRKPGKSILNQYLLLNFLIVTLLPISIIFVLFGSVSAPASPEPLRDPRSVVAVVGFMLALFILFSWLFFYRVRRRLLRLQEAMAAPAGDGIPEPVPPDTGDEIGRLADSFNRMIRQLEASRRREREEEALRRQLIANLSHDLRTPLTAIRGHAYRLKNEPLSGTGRESLDLIDAKVGYLGQLIDDLLSYTLLTSGKYPYRPARTDIVRLVRTSFAAWYPVFENAGFRIELELPEAEFRWEVDPQWMERVLDNYYQNIIRHAGSGRYVGVRVDAAAERIVIEDRGPGIGADSAAGGAGIGLSIAALMLQGMGLRSELATNERGTRVVIGKN